MTTTTTKTWTKELVQDHAKTAVLVEMYTLPFYLTALSSIKDTNHDAYRSLLSICIEEMLHLQLAANLCLALGTKPVFTAPNYDGTPIPFLKPYDPETEHHKLINAKLDALNGTTLDLMLSIETPSGLEPHRHPEKGTRKRIDREDAFEQVWDIEYHRTPQYPYDTIGEMYDALIAAIFHVGEDNFFPSNTNNQKDYWGQQSFTQKIGSFSDAQDAVKTISYQGEGKTTGKDKFGVPSHYRCENDKEDPSDLNEFSHYERLLKIKQHDLPEVYHTNKDQQNQEAQIKAVNDLQKSFTNLLEQLDNIWKGGDDKDFWKIMTGENGLIANAQKCWKEGVIPKWVSAEITARRAIL